MCRAYHIDYAVYTSRIAKGWAVENALTTPVRPRADSPKGKFLDHNGKAYQTFDELCKTYHMSTGCFQSRKKKGWSVKKILTTPVDHTHTGRRVKDHRGVEWPSITAMCKAWDITPDTYKGRIKLGFSLKDALCMPIKEKLRKKA